MVAACRRLFSCPGGRALLRGHSVLGPSRGSPALGGTQTVGIHRRTPRHSARFVPLGTSAGKTDGRYRLPTTYLQEVWWWTQPNRAGRARRPTLRASGSGTATHAAGKRVGHGDPRCGQAGEVLRLTKRAALIVRQRAKRRQGGRLHENQLRSQQM